MPKTAEHTEAKKSGTGIKDATRKKVFAPTAKQKSDGDEGKTSSVTPRVSMHRKRWPRHGTLGLRKAPLKRLFTKGGAFRVSDCAYDELRTIAYSFLRTLVWNTHVITEHAKRKTMTGEDVANALGMIGHPLYGRSKL